MYEGMLDEREDRRLISELKLLLDAHSDTHSEAAVLKIIFPSTEVLSSDAVVNFALDLVDALDRISTAGFLLSIGDEAMVMRSVDVVTALAICPFLQVGVGLKFRSRCRFADEVAAALADITRDRAANCAHLGSILKKLSTVVWSENCGSVVLNRMLPDYLAALLQLVFSPECRRLLLADEKAYDRRWCCLQLDQVVGSGRVFKPMVLREILVLQGLSERDPEGSINRTSISGSRDPVRLNRKVPRWLQKACGRILTDSLLSADNTGVASVMQAVLLDDDSSHDVMDRRAKALAEVLLSVPSGHERMDYMRRIMPQLMKIVLQLSSESAAMTGNGAVGNSESVTRQMKVCCVTVLHNLMLRAESDLWVECVEPHLRIPGLYQSPLHTVLVEKERLESMVALLDLLLMGCTERTSDNLLGDLLLKWLPDGVIHLHFSLLTQTYRMPQAVARTSAQVMSALVGCSSPASISQRILNSGHVEHAATFIQLRIEGDSFRGVVADGQGFVAELWSSNVLAFLEEHGHTTVLQSLFLELLSVVMEAAWGAGDRILDPPLGWVLLLQKLMESSSEVLMSDVDVFLKLSNSILLRATTLLQVHQGKLGGDSPTNVSSILCMLLTIISCLCEARGGLSPSQLQQLTFVVDICGKVGELCKSHSDWLPEVGDAAESVRVKWLTSLGADRADIASKSRSRSGGSAEQRQWQEAEDLVKDPMLPSRAAGLRKASQLVSSGNSFARERLDWVVSRCLECVEDEDSFLFLAAVQSLVELCSTPVVTRDDRRRYLQRILTIYCGKIHAASDRREDTSTSPGRQAEEEDVLMKVGEAITGLMRREGELLAAYRNLFVNSLLTACRHHSRWSPALAASVLSNLATLVGGLRWAVQWDVAEIWTVASSFIRPLIQPAAAESAASESLHVVRRRAAVLLVSRVCGLVSDEEGEPLRMMEALQHVLSPMYNCMKRVYSHDQDATCRLHAQTALQALSHAMTRLFLQPPSSLDQPRTIVGLPPL